MRGASRMSQPYKVGSPVARHKSKALTDEDAPSPDSVMAKGESWFLDSNGVSQQIPSDPNMRERFLVMLSALLTLLCLALASMLLFGSEAAPLLPHATPPIPASMQQQMHDFRAELQKQVAESQPWSEAE